MTQRRLEMGACPLPEQVLQNDDRRDDKALTSESIRILILFLGRTNSTLTNITNGLEQLSRHLESSYNNIYNCTLCI